MPPFQFRIASALRRARTIGEDRGIRVSLAGVHFAGRLTVDEAAVWELLLRALGQEPIRQYFERDECCEGCVQNSLPDLRQIESLIRLTKTSLGPEVTPVSAVLLRALLGGFGEFRNYLRGFIADTVRNTPWGDGNREEYLQAFHRQRGHLAHVLQQVTELLDHAVSFEPLLLHNTEWRQEAYVLAGEVEEGLFTTRERNNPRRGRRTT